MGPLEDFAELCVLSAHLFPPRRVSGGTGKPPGGRPDVASVHRGLQTFKKHKKNFFSVKKFANKFTKFIKWRFMGPLHDFTEFVNFYILFYTFFETFLGGRMWPQYIGVYKT